MPMQLAVPTSTAGMDVSREILPFVERSRPERALRQRRFRFTCQYRLNAHTHARQYNFLLTSCLCWLGKFTPFAHFLVGGSTSVLTMDSALTHRSPKPWAEASTSSSAANRWRVQGDFLQTALQRNQNNFACPLECVALLKAKATTSCLFTFE